MLQYACRRSARNDHAAFTNSTMASPNSLHMALPPMSRVRTSVSRNNFSIAFTMASAAWLWPRCSSIMAPDQIWPIGFEMPFPAISGALPCTGSNIEG